MFIAEASRHKAKRERRRQSRDLLGIHRPAHQSECRTSFRESRARCPGLYRIPHSSLLLARRHRTDPSTEPHRRRLYLHRNHIQRPHSSSQGPSLCASHPPNPRGRPKGTWHLRVSLARELISGLFTPSRRQAREASKLAPLTSRQMRRYVPHPVSVSACFFFTPPIASQYNHERKPGCEPTALGPAAPRLWPLGLIGMILSYNSGDLRRGIEQSQAPVCDTR
jgi:hypothetical protein